MMDYGIYRCPVNGLDYCISDGKCEDFADCPVRRQEEEHDRDQAWDGGEA